MSETYHVVLAITGYAYVDIEADDPIAAIAEASECWQLYAADATGHELTGSGWSSDEANYEINPV
jgi:hypothetical protein